MAALGPADRSGGTGGALRQPTKLVGRTLEQEVTFGSVGGRLGTLAALRILANAETTGWGWIHEHDLADWQFVAGRQPSPSPCSAASTPERIGNG